MSEKTKFAVVGGDLRQAYLADMLAGEGYSVCAAGFGRCADAAAEAPVKAEKVRGVTEAVKNAGCIILPLPFSLDGVNVNAPFSEIPIPLSEVFSAAGKGALVTGGRFTPEALRAAAAHGAQAADYYAREELAVLNAVPTAEGAVQIAMEELPVTINGSRCLVTGFGRVGKALCRDLSALGADVVCCARRCSDLAWIKSCGWSPVPFGWLPSAASHADAVFNTVPAQVFTGEVLGNLKKGCLLIDLASKPGGVDLAAAGRLGVKAFRALSLPGRVAPMTAGGIIKDTVLNILREKDCAAGEGRCGE
jgi:dipicolinate synthase subunit A